MKTRGFVKVEIYYFHFSRDLTLALDKTFMCLFHLGFALQVISLPCLVVMGLAVVELYQFSHVTPHGFVIYVSCGTWSLCHEWLYMTIGSCDFIDINPSSIVTSPTFSLVAIGLKKMDIMFFLCHVISRDQVIKGSCDFVAVVDLVVVEI